jgi:RNA polymerase sigma factor (sigma-70 family)
MNNMDLYEELNKAKKNDKDAIYEIIKDFSNTLKKISDSLHYEEANTDMIIELLKLIKNIDIKKFQGSSNRQIAKYINMHLSKRSLNLIKAKENQSLDYLEINYDILKDETIADVESIVCTSMLIEFLEKQQKNVSVMKFIHGYSEKDIAQILGISRQAVNRAKNRALNNLRKIFTEEKKVS